MRRVAIPAVIVMITVVAYVAAAAWNSSSEPLQTVTLTERELVLASQLAPTGDNPGLEMQLQYQGRHDPLESRNWLPEARLREMGFVMHVPAGAPQAVHVYDRVPPRLAWIVFEYGGAAWRAIEQRRELLPAHLRPQESSSMLVPIDAGPDYEGLRRRYSPTHLIVRGIIGLNYLPPDAGGPLLYGTLREIVPGRVSVPYRFRSLLQRPPQAGEQVQGPRYEAELAIGALGLPYLQRVRLRE